MIADTGPQDTEPPREQPVYETILGSPEQSPHLWERRSFSFGEIAIELAAPRDPDALLDDPGVLEASAREDYMPYWAYVWSSSIALGAYLVSNTRTLIQPGTRTLELGAGLGLVGLVAAKLGADVTFNEWSGLALRAISYSARLNKLDNVRFHAGSWLDLRNEQYRLVLGADVLYEERCAGELAELLPRILARDGIAVLADPHRPTADRFVREVSRWATVRTEERVRGTVNDCRHRIIVIRWRF